MAEKKISELTAATEVSDSDLFVMEQGGAAKSATAALLKSVFGGGSSGSSVTVDATLTVSGAAADAKAVGDRLTKLELKAATIDYTNWDSGSFSVKMSDGTTKSGTVSFDSEGKPTSVTLDGHTMSITLPA